MAHWLPRNGVAGRQPRRAGYPHVTSEEHLAPSQGQLQPPDSRMSAISVRDEPREVAMRSLATAEKVAQSPDVFATRPTQPA